MGKMWWKNEDTAEMMEGNEEGGKVDVVKRVKWDGEEEEEYEREKEERSARRLREGRNDKDKQD